MHGAVAATEVVYYASRKLVASAMHCRQQTTGPIGVAELAPLSVCFVVVVVVGNRQKNRE